MAFYFPQAHAQIDWSQEYHFLDQELLQVVQDGHILKALESNPNPFALLLYQHGWSKEQVIEVFRVIDWLMRLPRPACKGGLLFLQKSAQFSAQSLPSLKSAKTGYLSNRSIFLAMQKTGGFTLVELMVTVATAAVLLGIAVPSFRQIVQSNRLTAATNEFMAAINFARSEAIKRGQSVWLCKTADGTACALGGKNWETGWMAFLDTDKNDTWSTGDEILRVWQGLPQGYTLRPNNNFDNYLRYGPRGAANNIGTFAVCYQNQIVGAKAIVITRLRPRLGRDNNGNKIPENDSGDIASCYTS